MSAYFYKDGLESARLTTRFLDMADVPEWSNFFLHDHCTAFIPGLKGKQPEENAITWIERQQNRYRNGSYGLQALINKENGAFMGMCGLILQDVDGHMQVEVGYHLLPPYWGKGYATEAATTFKDYAFSSKICNSLISIIHVDNLRSQQVAGRNGMQREKQLRYRDIDVFIYRVNK